MNRYQLELMEMDRRHRLKMRAIYSVAAGLLAVVVAWNIGISPVEAWRTASAWILGEEVSDPAPTRLTQGVEEANFSQEPVVVSEPVDLLGATAASTSASRQRLYLTETTPGRNPREGSARLGTDPRAPQTYAAGAILLNGARLAEIHRSYVLLERNDEQFRLELTGELAHPEDTTVSDLAYVGGQRRVERPAVETDLVSELLRASPVYQDDQLVGMQIYPGTRSSTFHQLGLRSGDIVLAVDGAPVFDPAASRLFEPLAQGASMTVTVRRESQIHTISIDGHLVAKPRGENVYASEYPAGSPPG